LLERYTGRAAVPSTRTALLRDLDRLGADRMIAEAGPEIGLRSAGEVRARLATLQDDDAAPPLAGAEADVLSVILGIKAALPDAHEQLQDVCVDIPALVPAIDRFGRRIDALHGAGIDVDGVPFEASFGRTTMEYYDGFVFGFLARGRPDLPPVATGGRYDALTRLLGGGRESPAVGGVIRPGMLHQISMETGR
jgi:ATP phosphoribosyltransferase regulatory subunit